MPQLIPAMDDNTKTIISALTDMAHQHFGGGVNARKLDVKPTTLTMIFPPQEPRAMHKFAADLKSRVGTAAQCTRNKDGFTVILNHAAP